MSEQPSQTPQPPNGSQEHSNPATTAPIESTTDPAVKSDPDLDASIEQDIDMNAEPAQATGDDNVPLPTDVDPMAAAPPPSKKETSLREFLGKMDDYAPIVSDIFYLSFFGFRFFRASWSCSFSVSHRAHFLLASFPEPKILY